MAKTIQLKTVIEWISMSVAHSCGRKYFSPYNDEEKGIVGHACVCGDVFTLSVDDYLNSIGELQTGVRQQLIVEAMKSDEGRMCLARACCL